MPDLGDRPTPSVLAGKDWDVVVVGGGITGAGILRELARLGARVLLLEQGDFACGTSSRSSKLVHGGLHYLARLEIRLARAACRERERLVMSGGDLVRPVPFILPVRRWQILRRWKMGLGLAAYGLVGGGSVVPRRLSRETLDGCIPGLAPGISGAFVYRDAVTDDAGLVLRVIREGCDLGGRAVNYMEVSGLLRGPEGEVAGVTVRDHATGHTTEIRARAVVSATGPWGDDLREALGGARRIRWVRGSHLVLARPISQEHAVVSLHPDSGRPFYLIPWRGRTLVGSTHVEEGETGGSPSRIQPHEVAYLARGLDHLFPGRALDPGEVISSFSGIRPIVDRRARDPARASRDHAIWEEDGLLTVTGGKLTTFQTMAFDVVDRLRARLPGLPSPGRGSPSPLAPLDPLPADLEMDRGIARHLQHRHGTRAVLELAGCSPHERWPVGELSVSAGELRWIATHEAVVHLDDLLLRRLRIGLTARRGGVDLLDALRPVVQAALGWSDVRWREEVLAYRHLWQASYAPLGGGPVEIPRPLARSSGRWGSGRRKGGKRNEG